MTVAETLSKLLHDGPSYDLPTASDIAGLRDRVDHAVRSAESAWGLPPDRQVIRLPKSRIAMAARCGRQLAKSEVDISPAMALLGNAIDTEAALITIRGTQQGDAWQNAVDVWRANDERDKLAQLDSLNDAERDELAELVRERAVGLTSAFGPIERGWWPRAQDRVSIPVGDDRVVLSGVFDIFLGGGRSRRPSVVVEVKAGSTWKDNADDGRLYALLAAMRDGECPAAVVTVTAADAVTFVEPMRATVLENAVERIERVLDLVFEVASGSVPEPSAGPWCDRCSVRSGCPAVDSTSATSERPV